MSDSIRPQRPPLAERLKSALEESLEWVNGNGSARVTEFVDGERIGPMMMTRAELAARRAARETQSCLSYDAERDALHIRLREAEIQKREEVEPGVVLSYDEGGQVVGVDVLVASQRIQKQTAQTAQTVEEAA